MRLTSEDRFGPSHGALGGVLLVALLWMVVGCARAPQLRPLPAGAVVLAFGDSLTRGTGAEEHEAYPAVLARLSGWTVVNAGIPGERSGAGLQRLPEALAEYQPALVLLCHGGNDILAGEEPEAIMANLEAMIRLSREAGADVVMLAVPQRGLVLRPAPLYPAVAKRNGVLLVEGVIAEVLRRNTLKSDYIHPNAAGYERIAGQLWADLQRAQL